jgi:hypothetical protein
MLDGLAPHFIAKYVGPFEILHNLHPNVYIKVATTFVAHPMFHV